MVTQPQLLFPNSCLPVSGGYIMPTGQYFRQQKLVMQVKVHRNMSKMEHSVETVLRGSFSSTHYYTHN